MNADFQRFPRATGLICEAATGWLRFGVLALPKTAPPRSSCPAI